MYISKALLLTIPYWKKIKICEIDFYYKYFDYLYKPLKDDILPYLYHCKCNMHYKIKIRNMESFYFKNWKIKKISKILLFENCFLIIYHKYHLIIIRLVLHYFYFCINWYILSIGYTRKTFLWWLSLPKERILSPQFHSLIETLLQYFPQSQFNKQAYAI